MNFEQAYTAIKDFIQHHQDLFAGVSVEFAFDTNCPPIGDWSNDENMGVLIKGDGIGNKSGIYFYATPEEEIIYIGKAGQNNLHERVWDHLKTPQELTQDKKRFFHKHKFVNEEPQYADAFTNGKVRLGVVTVSNQLLVSLLEVYLQTFHCAKYGKLPALNKQIG
jgi:hypothetical protein